MAWLFLLVAGCFEMLGVGMIGRFHIRRSWQTLFVLIASFGLSFVFLAFAMETLPMGTAYAVWTGIGASGGAVLGMVLYKEPVDWRRILFIGMIVVSAVALKITS